MKHWEIRGSQYLIKDRWITLRADECILPNGSLASPFYVMEEKEWVHIVAIDAEDRILITRQYRHGAAVICSELPGGTVDSNETPLDAAKRELQEETGFTARTWIKVASPFANPARQTNRIHCFLARDLTAVGGQKLDDTEEIDFDLVSQSEVMNLIKNGSFCQAMHIASFFLALDSLKKGVL